MTRPLQLRFLLIALALVVAAVWFPQFALQLLAGLGYGPVALFMPVFSTSPCTSCTGTFPSAVQITFTGVANGTCSDCANLNATWQLNTQVLATLPVICSFEDDGPEICGGPATPKIEFAYRISDKYYAASHTGSALGNIANYASTGSISYPVNCQDSHSGMTCVTGCSGGQCDHTSATADFDPL